MQTSDIISQLKTYISLQVLDGKDIGLDETTPLLEWGIINSLEVVRLLTFIQQAFTVSIPPENLSAEHFVTLTAIANLIQNAQQEYGRDSTFGDSAQRAGI